MLGKLFNWGKRKTDPARLGSPGIDFGRYSDNNKPLHKVNLWKEADHLFKEKKFNESVDAFFKYLRDDDTSNVAYNRNGDEARFELYQGSKVVKGAIKENRLSADVKLAKMPEPSTPVMRRLLEMNFGLYYCRFSLQESELHMRFDTDMSTANPSKLYYGLKELATKSDKQDDLLVEDFSLLESVDSDHVVVIPEQEKEVKHKAMVAWIDETLEMINTVDADKFSGGISYLLLALVYRIDFLITPEGKFLNELERISDIYFKKDERPVIVKNRDMIEAFQKLKEKPKEEIFKNLFRSKYTFSIVTPQSHKVLADAIHEANENMLWYRDNNYEYFAQKIIEYGLTFCQYSYSLPRPVTQLLLLFMQINYSEYFSSLGYDAILYSANTKRFKEDEIIVKIKDIQAQWQKRHPFMVFKTEQLQFKNLLQFNNSFITQVASLNMDSPA